MTVSLLGVPFAVYNRQLFSMPFKRGGASGNLVAALIDWSQYGPGQGANQFVVQVRFGVGGNIPNGFKPISLYINNLGSSQPIYVFFPDNDYEIVAPANSEGWYPIISNAPIAWIGGLNFQLGNLPLTTVFFTDLFVPPYVNVAVPQALMQELASPALGGGARSLADIGIVIPGQSYANGGLSVTGGGGHGATATGALDEWGRFISIFITTPGTDFTGPPIVTPTAANPAAAAFNGAANYNPGEKVTFGGTEWKWNGAVVIHCGATVLSPANIGGVTAGSQWSYNGIIWQALKPFDRGMGFPPQGAYWELIGSAIPETAYSWLNSNSPGGTAAAFSTALTSTAAVILTGGLGAPALGDQLYSKSFPVTAIATLDGNVFGSPFGSGFIYLNAISVMPAIDPAATLSFGLVLQTSTGIVIWEASGNTSQTPMIDISGINVKLDATQTYELNVTAYNGANNVVNVTMAYTISET